MYIRRIKSPIYKLIYSTRNHYKINSIGPYQNHVSVCVLVKCPGLIITWIRNIEVYSPFITINISLGCNTTYVSNFLKFNLKPIFFCRTLSCAPTVTSGIVKSAVIGVVTIIVLRRSYHLAIRDDIGISNTNSITEAGPGQCCVKLVKTFKLSYW